MLTFYPEFEVDNITDNEIILLLDLSNSMKVLCIIFVCHDILPSYGICPVMLWPQCTQCMRYHK